MTKNFLTGEQTKASSATFLVPMDKHKLPNINHIHNGLSFQKFDENKFLQSSGVSTSTAIKRKRKISKVTNYLEQKNFFNILNYQSFFLIKVKTKSRSQRDDIAEAVIRGDLEKIEDIIEVLDMVHGRGDIF